MLFVFEKLELVSFSFLDYFNLPKTFSEGFESTHIKSKISVLFPILYLWKVILMFVDPVDIVPRKFNATSVQLTSAVFLVRIFITFLKTSVFIYFSDQNCQETTSSATVFNEKKIHPENADEDRNF